MPRTWSFVALAVLATCGSARGDQADDECFASGGDSNLMQRTVSFKWGASTDAKAGYTLIHSGGYPGHSCSTNETEISLADAAGSVEGCAAATEAAGSVVFMYYAHPRNPGCYHYPGLAGGCPDGTYVDDLQSSVYMLQEVASAEDDPHVTSLAGERFSINTPSMYTLLRLPKDEQQHPFLEIRANVSEEAPCKSYIKWIELTGDLIQGSSVEVLPLARDRPGSNSEGSVTERPFSLVVQSGGARTTTSWDRAAQEWGAGKSLSPQVSVLARAREETAKLKAFDFVVGSALISIQQASHQALNIKLSGLRSLGADEFGGLLGTGKHNADVEKLTDSCRSSRGNPATSELVAAGSGHNYTIATLTASW